METLVVEIVAICLTKSETRTVENSLVVPRCLKVSCWKSFQMLGCWENNKQEGHDSKDVNFIMSTLQ